MGKIISVASGKGGTGKSTVCVTLGTALVKRGHKVLLIDCDSGMRGLDIMMGISKSLVLILQMPCAVTAQQNRLFTRAVILTV